MNTSLAAAQARVAVSTIRAWCRRGVIAATKHAGRWNIDPTSLTHRITKGHMKRPTRKAPLTAEAIIAVGGRRWQKNGMDRVYINDWATFADIHVTRYGTGNISSASIGGRRIANGRAYNLLGAISKVYFDAADGRLYAQHHGAREYEIRYLDGARDHLDLVQLVFDGIRAAVTAS